MNQSKKYIYLAFYSIIRDPRDRSCDLTQTVTHWLTGPFTHVQLCFPETFSPSNPSVLCLNLTRRLGKVTYGYFDLSTRTDFHFICLKVPSKTYLAIQKLCKELDKLQTSFSLAELYGLNACCREPCSMGKKYWFCSELITWILQESGVLSPESIQPHRCSCTDLYLLVRRLPTAVQLFKNPFDPREQHKKPDLWTPDDVYIHYKGLARVEQIPDAC